MPVLTIDPNEAVCPDFASEDYTAARNAMINENVDKAIAIVMLTNAWNAINAAEKEIWTRQRQIEGEEARERERNARKEHGRLNEARKLEEETNRAEEKKHRTKYTEISQVPPPITILPMYATTRLQKGAYVEMWYFTNDGIDYALKTLSAIDENTIKPSADQDGDATWISAVASKGSRTAVDDRDLTWEQLLVAIPRFLDAIRAAKWTEQRQTMMTDLFTGLQAHPFRSSQDPLDRAALLRYLSEQRRLWHQAIDAGTGAWNIGLVSETLLWRASDAVRKEQMDREDAERARIVSGKSHPRFPPN